MDTKINWSRKIRYGVESFVWYLTAPLEWVEAWCECVNTSVGCIFNVLDDLFDSFIQQSNYRFTPRTCIVDGLWVLTIIIPLMFLSVADIFCRAIRFIARFLRSIPFRLLIWYDGLWVPTDQFHPSLDLNLPLAWWMTPKRRERHINNVVRRRENAFQRDMVKCESRRNVHFDG